MAWGEWPTGNLNGFLGKKKEKEINNHIGEKIFSQRREIIELYMKNYIKLPGHIVCPRSLGPFHILTL